MQQEGAAATRAEDQQAVVLEVGDDAAADEVRLLTIRVMMS